MAIGYTSHNPRSRLWLWMMEAGNQSITQFVSEATIFEARDYTRPNPFCTVQTLTSPNYPNFKLLTLSTQYSLKMKI